MSATSSIGLSARGVTLVLGDGDQQITALNDVALSVSKGEYVAVVGPSGSGKSSLLAVCGGLRTPTKGQVEIGGVEITTLSESERTAVRRRKIGFVFQQSNLVASLSALDQLLLMVHVDGRSPTSADQDRARKLLDSVGLASRAARRPGQLSGGECQRIGIARALMNAPDVLLVDEPTSMLDHNRGRDIVKLLATQTKEHGVATLMVTHDASMLEWADRVLRMEDGRVLAAGGASAQAAQ
ncbi:MAG: ABC transporter ATP-binding protein [Rhodospirillaceae bacterium]|nr:ABC transporter ATP-binding protein [Rhodospirillaceae bacterium]